MAILTLTDTVSYLNTDDKIYNMVNLMIPTVIDYTILHISFRVITYTKFVKVCNGIIVKEQSPPAKLKGHQ